MKFTAVTDVTVWLESLEKVRHGRRLAAPQFLKPYHFVTLVPAMQDAEQCGVSVELPGDLESYAVRMGLWEVARIDAPHTVGRNDPSGRFMPLECLLNRDDVEPTALKLVDIFRNQDQISAGTLSSLDIALREILENCTAHSAIEKRSFACAQVWPRGAKAQIAIMDLGMGIRASLQENPKLHDRLMAENGCEMATQYGVTGKPNRGHSGYGLTLTRELLEGNCGNLIICSHDEFFQSCNLTSASGFLHRSFPGTLVLLEWNINRPLDSKAVYEGWPKPEGYSDDDFDLDFF